MFRLSKIMFILSFVFSASCLFDSEPNFDTDEYQYAAAALDAYFVFRDSLPTDYSIYTSIDDLYKSVNDPYTRYYPPDSSQNFLDNLILKNIGIGLEIDSALTGYIITDIIPSSPAASKDLNYGDTIVKINNISVVAQTSGAVDATLGGARGTVKILIIKRAAVDTAVTISVTVGEYSGRSVFLETINDSIAYIKLTTFSKNTCLAGGSAEELSAVIDSSANSKWSDWSILDLRNNSGGNIEQAIKITSEFMDSGKSIVKTHQRVYDSSSSSFITEETFLYSGSGGSAKNRKFYILIDSLTESESELMISGLTVNRQDTEIITIGTKSKGQGRLQFVGETINHGLVYITSTIISSVTGVNFDIDGISPKVLVPNANFALDTAISRITK